MNMDIISIHCPYTPETFHLLSKRKTKIIEKTSILINTSRGEIIGENAPSFITLVKKIFGAGLDVFENEPQVSPKLFEAENVALLSHISSSTSQSRVAMGNRVLKNIELFLAGKKPKDIVKLRSRYNQNHLQILHLLSFYFDICRFVTFTIKNNKFFVFIMAPVSNYI